jgi:hypothetical protein
MRVNGRVTVAVTVGSTVVIMVVVTPPHQGRSLVDPEKEMAEELES